MESHQNDPIARYEATKAKKEVAPVKPGMNVRVHVRIREGEKERIQPFEGMVVAVQGKGIGRTCTVRRVVRGIGVERVFSLHAPSVTTIEILGAERVRRAKLSFLRKTNVKRRKREDSKTLERAHKEQDEQRQEEERKRKETEEGQQEDNAKQETNLDEQKEEKQIT